MTYETLLEVLDQDNNSTDLFKIALTRLFHALHERDGGGCFIFLRIPDALDQVLEDMRFTGIINDFEAVSCADDVLTSCRRVTPPWLCPSARNRTRGNPVTFFDDVSHNLRPDQLDLIGIVAAASNNPLVLNPYNVEYDQVKDFVARSDFRPTCTFSDFWDTFGTEVRRGGGLRGTPSYIERQIIKRQPKTKEPYSGSDITSPKERRDAIRKQLYETFWLYRKTVAPRYSWGSREKIKNLNGELEVWAPALPWPHPDLWERGVDVIEAFLPDL